MQYNQRYISQPCHRGKSGSTFAPSLHFKGMYLRCPAILIYGYYIVSLQGFSVLLWIFSHNNMHPSTTPLRPNNIQCRAIPDSTYKEAPPTAMLFYFVHVPSWNYYTKFLNLLCEIRGPSHAVVPKTGSLAIKQHKVILLYIVPDSGDLRVWRVSKEHACYIFSETVILIKFPSLSLRENL